MSLRDDIFAAGKLASEPLAAPLVGIPGLRVRVMSAAERDSLNAETYDFSKAGDPAGGIRNMTARVIVRTLVDADGNRIFTDADAEQLGREYPAGELEPVYKQAAGFNKLNEKDAEEAEKNSAAAPSG